MTVDQMHSAAEWIMDNTTGTIDIQPTELGLALYESHGDSTRHVGYIRTSDGRVVLWYPGRKKSKE